jgi:hypothetical protein
VLIAALSRCGGISDISWGGDWDDNDKNVDKKLLICQLEKAFCYSSKPRYFKVTFYEAELGCAWLSPPHVSSVKLISLCFLHFKIQVNKRQGRVFKASELHYRAVYWKDDSEIVSPVLEQAGELEPTSASGKWRRSWRVTADVNNCGHICYAQQSIFHKTSCRAYFLELGFVSIVAYLHISLCSTTRQTKKLPQWLCFQYCFSGKQFDWIGLIIVLGKSSDHERTSRLQLFPTHYLDAFFFFFGFGAVKGWERYRLFEEKCIHGLQLDKI